MSDDQSGHPNRVAAIQLTESFLDELLRRVRRSPRFPDSFSQRISLPPPAVGGAELELNVDETAIRLTSSGGGRIEIRVGMRGRVVWDVALRRIAQNLRVSFALLVRPDVHVDASESVVLGADFGRARVTDVSVKVLDTPYVPGAAPTELLGPVGRRLLDTASGEAIGAFVRGLGWRSADLTGPVGTWLSVLGSDPEGSRVVVRDGCLAVEVFDGSLPDGAKGEEPVTGSDPVHVTVDKRHAPRLLGHWARELTGEDPTMDLTEVEFGFVGDLIQMNGRMRRSLPGLGRGRPVEADVLVSMRPECDPEYVTFAVPHVAVPWTSVRAVRPVVQRMLHRWAASHLRVPALWQLPVPFVADRTWILGIRSIEVAGPHVEVGLTSWFAPD